MGPVRNPVLLHRVRLFSLVPLVWESNPKLQGGWAGRTRIEGVDIKTAVNRRTAGHQGELRGADKVGS
jgi:hypothetical protein